MCMAKPVTFATAVWGQWYADIFSSVLARSLIADRNFPSLKGRGNVRFVIYTDDPTAKRIQSSATWRRLAQAIEVTVRKIDILYDKPIDEHHRIWAQAKSEAAAFGGAIVFVAPDTMWADGSIARIVDLLDQGYGGIFFPGFRVAFDTFMPAMNGLYGKDDGPISLTPTDLMARAMEHMHPLKTVFLRKSRNFPDFSENMLWPVGDEGFVLREPLVHSLMAVDPSVVEINDYTVPVRQDQLDRIYWSRGSDDVLFVSLGPLGRDLGWFDAADPVDAARIGLASTVVDGPIVDSLIRRKFRFHKGISDEARWRAVERASDLFMHRAIVTREGIRIFDQLERSGCSRAAAALAVALFTDNFSHAAVYRNPVTIFCPSDSSLPGTGGSEDDWIFDGANRRDVRRFLLGHVVEGSHSLGSLVRLNTGLLPGSNLFVRRQSERLTVNNVAILKGDIKCGNHLIHVVNGPLVSLGESGSPFDIAYGKQS